MSQFYDPAVAIPTLVGSLLSCVASGLIFISYIVLPQIPHFRHILILNLAGADFFNSLNNSISGIYLFANGRLTPGPWCTANGFLGQITVQGTDFSILLIAIVTVTTLQSTVSVISDVSWKSKFLVALCVWLVPLATSLTGVGLQAYRPVSGNWCWISAEKPVLRYALAHGWRFAIIIITISLYVYLWCYFRNQFREIRHVSQPTPIQNMKLHPIGEVEELNLNSTPGDQKTHFPYPDPEEVYLKPDSKGSINNDEDDDFDFALRTKHASGAVPISSSKALTMITSYTASLSSSSPITPYSYSHTASLERKQHEIRKMLLLNAYPIAYVILWIPGILNRILELSGGESRVLRILQSSTQYVGLANAITYGYNESRGSLGFGGRRGGGGVWVGAIVGPDQGGDLLNAVQILEGSRKC